MNASHPPAPIASVVARKGATVGPFAAVRTSRDVSLVAFAAALLVAFALHAGALLARLDASAADGGAAARKAADPAARHASAEPAEPAELAARHVSAEPAESAEAAAEPRLAARRAVAPRPAPAAASSALAVEPCATPRG